MWKFAENNPMYFTIILIAVITTVGHVIAELLEVF